MATIEERAGKYAHKHGPDRLAGSWLTAEQIRGIREVMIAAYLAGSERTQQDYADHYSRHARCPVTR